MNVKYLITDNSITVHFDGQTHIVARGDALSERLIEVLRSGKHEEVPNLVSASMRITNFSKGNFTVENGDILVNGIKAPDALGKKIVKFANEGLPYQPLVKFAEHLQQNPSRRSVEELFMFLEKNDHPITPDGLFIGYKRIRADFKDIYSGTFNNTPGALVEMARQEVDEDANQTCSRGLHASNWEYCTKHYASKDAESDVIVALEIDPADVVSVPVDYNNAKMRVSKYRVIEVVKEPYQEGIVIRKVGQ